MIPNPNAPDEYKYETDYRKIPRKYLNPKIPQGRGKIKWQAFATLPQQFEILEQIIKDQNKIEKPLLTHDSLDNLDQIFQIKIQNDELCTISYWEDGSISNYTGKILKIDTINGYFTFYDSTSTKHTFFNTNVYNIS
ncbi:YolD-like family protein [Staphylococcus aureus]|uniref:YolD-like family protein n=1 Tax=Staphylococcus aureus TaxID=1280 RepID=UPI001CEDB41D|nr:YolD-like family protein [Staphylococcus aureus]UCJ63355.1 YolD-like family protein [Staphylococcus aureus]UCJ68062.1 YolD-like family protein [Staphylococcus aureus]UCJ69610.1 YolD-like family protein [Staphylococcus aureus]UCJ72475.1 YolD-like family protein [Staphylococcus aureus]UCJ75588.1 YolD-like family protein [Staphylococcus aureus]